MQPMTPAPTTHPVEERRRQILAQLEEDIRYFRGASRIKRILYRAAQVVSLGCGCAVPVLIAVWPDSTALSASVASAAAFATGAIGLFRLREEWVQYVLTREALIHEHLAFMTQTGAYADAKDPEKALQKVVARRHQILDANLDEWRKTLTMDERETSRSSPGAAAVT